MEKSFDSVSFVSDLSQELISGFEKAGKATTPATVGAAREHAVREKLERILPGHVGIGSGFVFDSYGRTSKQTDIVLFEKGICPIFSIEGTPETTYYPCESVIAVGEIKSTLDSDDLVDAFAKIESVKSNVRYVPDSINWRKYLGILAAHGAESERYSQRDKPLDQVFGFILCQSIGLKVETLLTKCKEEAIKRETHLLPNIIVSLNDGIVVWNDSKNSRICIDAHNADSLFMSNSPVSGFQYLLSRLNIFISSGRTSAVLPFNKYILDNSFSSFNGTYVLLNEASQPGNDTEKEEKDS